MKHRFIRLLYINLIITGISGLIALGVVLAIALKVETCKFPDCFGNHEHNIKKMSEVDPNYFTFFAMGDIQNGTTTFLELLSIAKQDKPSFGVILGDTAPEPWLICQKLLAYKIRQAKLTFPLFLVLGNHEVDENGEFGCFEYEKLNGPSQFHFTIGNNLFIFLRNADPYEKTREYIKYLNKVLSQYAGKDMEIFVFMHVPPIDFHKTVISSGAVNGPEFIEIARKAKIKYVFSGDYHGYAKNLIEDTTYLVTGGAGGRLRGDHGRLYHFTRIAVNHGQCTETVIAIQQKNELLLQLERNIVIFLWPWMVGNWIGITITAMWAIGMPGLVLIGIRGIRRLKAQAGNLTPQP